jgi:hypothetical protein
MISSNAYQSFVGKQRLAIEAQMPRQILALCERPQ